MSSPAAALATLSRRALGLLEEIGQLCLPAQCAACGASWAADGFLCDACDAALQRLIDAPACLRCAMPLAEPDIPCPFCRNRGIGRFRRIVALGRFEEPLKTLIHRMKYQRQWPIAEHLARRLSRKPAAAELLSACDAVAPVPLHHWRQVSRGYNQSDLAAGVLCRAKLIHPLRRVRPTQPQATLGSHQRRADNVRDAFHLTRPKLVAGKSLVLVDDVMTSAATLKAVAQCLRPAGPRRLDVLVLAIADPQGRAFQSV